MVVIFSAIFVVDTRLIFGYDFGASLNTTEIKYYGNFNNTFSFKTFVIILTQRFFLT